MSNLETLHALAVENNKTSFKNADGYTVFTSLGLLEKKKCCGGKCTFCPYSHSEVRKHVCDPDTCGLSMQESTRLKVKVDLEW